MSAILGNRSDPEERGVIPNSFDHVFTHIARTQNKKFLVRASYLEIYQVRTQAIGMHCMYRHTYIGIHL